MEATTISVKKILLENSSQIASQVVDLQYQKQPNVWEKYGEEGKKMSIRDVAYHLPFLAEAIDLNNKNIFTNYIIWVKKLFHGLKLPESTMIVTLECMHEVISNEHPEIAEKVNQYIQDGLDAMNSELSTSESYIDLNSPLGDIAEKYNTLLLQGNRKEASDIILKTVENGIPIKDIYIHVFQRSQYEIGRLWLDNKITVAKEHFCSAATQQIMSQLYPYIFNTDRIGKTMIAANVGKELHEIGIRMVSDFFEMEGWDTYYLGANTPANTIIKAIEENNADILGLSIAIPHHISSLRQAIIEIREKYDDKIKIMIGGYALKELGTNYKDFFADGYASDANKAIELANTLT